MIPGQGEGCNEKHSKCNTKLKMVHLRHVFDRVNMFHKLWFQNTFHKKRFMLKSSQATIMSRDNKSHEFQCKLTKMHFYAVVQWFFIASLYFVSEFTKIKSISDHMLQGHLIMWNNVPGEQNDYLSKRALKRIFIGSRYSLNITQDPTITSIWK